MSYSIIVPTRNPDNLKALIYSFLDHNESLQHLIVVDDDESGRVERICLADNIKRVQGLKPFIFARAINQGIATVGDSDCLLANDDTRLLSDLGFGYLSSIANENPQYGIISAGITGAVGNTEQIAQPGTRLREAKHHTLVFVCVYLRREVLEDLLYAVPMEPGGPGHDGYRSEQLARVEWMDERFVNYGFCDDDMCERVRRLDLKLGIFDGCVVEHGVLESSYRGNHGNTGLSDLEPNRKRFIEKWGFAPGQAPQRMQPESGAAHRKVEW